MPWEQIHIPWLKCPRCGSNHFRICGQIALNKRVIDAHSIYCGNFGCNHFWKLRGNKLLKFGKLRRRKIIRKAIHA